MSLEFSAKTPAATPVLQMDFSDRLNAGENIVSATWAITEASTGKDVTTDMLIGAVDLGDLPRVKQQVKAGVSGTRYLHTCLATTDQNNRVVDGVVEQLVTVRP